MKRLKTEKAPPGARRLIESLRGLGYECHTAIADIIDNSISANATEIYVDIFTKDQFGEPAIMVADNGGGMDRTGLIEALRFGADQQYSSDDLGKYGLGLKTASLSQCRKLTVATKPKPSRGSRSRRCIMRWDLDHVYDRDDWELLVLEEGDLSKAEKGLLSHEVNTEHGTTVLWTDMEEIFPWLYNDNGTSSRHLSQLFEDLEIHLSMVFHKFMEGRVSGKSKLKIFLGEKELSAWDPFCLSESATASLTPETYKIEVGGRQKKVTVSPYILPKEEKFSNPQARKLAAGPRGWNQQQGFYFYRNGRMLQSGGWSYLRAPDEHNKLLRIAVEFSAELDREFEINVTKMKAKIPTAIWDALKEKTSKWSQKSRQVYDSKSRSSGVSRSATRGSIQDQDEDEAAKSTLSSPEIKLGAVSMALSNAPSKAVHASVNGKSLKVIVPYKHVSATAFHAKRGRTIEQRNVMLALLAVIEAVVSGSIKPSQVPVEALRKLVQRNV